MATGTVKWFNDSKGMGFILPEDGGRDLFVHRSEVKTDSQILQEGQKVEFETQDADKGPKAVNVRAI